MAALVIATSLIAPAGGRTQGGGPDPALVEAACSVPPRFLERTVRGYREDRVGHLQLFPKGPAFIGHGGLPHSGAWDYISDVPLFLYGPGYIREAGSLDRPATVADLAPTMAELMGFDLPGAEGAVLHEALVPAAERPEPPRLIVTMVWDAAGDVVLDEWADAWPTLRGLIDEGAWYENANVGSSPPSTAQIHATIGTGAFPRTHGLTSHHLLVGRNIVAPWEAGPSLLLRPTLADLYDRAGGNRPLVGIVGTVALHLGMVGHGSMWGGGDRDVAVLRELANAQTQGAEGGRWNLPPNVAGWFRLPPYVNDLPPLADYLDVADRVDGKADGRWRSLPLADDPQSGFNTPARIPFQSRLIREVITREGFGSDEVPDLFYVNHKLIDHIGHVQTMNSLEMRDAVATQDADLGELIGFLDEAVGKGRWVLALTADHGHTPDPAVTGNFMISPVRVAGAVQSRFDTDGDDRRIVKLTQPTALYLDEEELAESGATLEEISRYIMTLTKEQTAADGIEYTAEEATEPVFQAVFPSSMLRVLPCLSEEAT